MSLSFDRNTIKLLRIPFSFFLMPVFFLALSQSDLYDSSTWLNVAIVFVVLHLFVYPASNGYNSYMDRDEGSIGGIKNPPMPTKNLFYASIIFDLCGLALSFWISIEFFAGILLYIVVSRAYSWKKIRLKKYPIIGFLSVVIFQGFATFINIYIGVNNAMVEDVLDSGLIYPAIASSFMIGGVYPLTQIYQHGEDKKNNDKTISLLLGYKGTFIFSCGMFAAAAWILFNYFSYAEFLLFSIFLAPVGIFFTRWLMLVWLDETEANYENTMRMNIIASVCMNACFITIFFIDRLI